MVHNYNLSALTILTLLLSLLLLDCLLDCVYTMELSFFVL
jgi:hypothetical protein